jgi:hypothetical protein
MEESQSFIILFQLRLHAGVYQFDATSLRRRRLP